MPGTVRNRRFIGAEALPVTSRGKWRRSQDAAGFSVTGLTVAGGVNHGSSGVTETVGTATPEGAVTAPIGSTFRRTDGGAGTSFYVKESGAGNTGWVGK